MRRMLTMVAAAAVTALAAVPVLADAPVDGQLCGDVVVVVNGEAVIDEFHCLPPEGEPGLPI
ncbi:MAG TPA: hypothetical protein VNU01_08850 [Egibacteraceae bacterium]|nr:hypothetical protein [Egibacteraceae bacterium]